MHVEYVDERHANNDFVQPARTAEEIRRLKKMLDRAERNYQYRTGRPIGAPRKSPYRRKKVVKFYTDLMYALCGVAAVSMLVAAIVHQ